MQFMIFVDRFANIKKVLGCEPAGIIKEGKSLLDLIVRESHELILSLHQGGTGENLCGYITTQLSIDGKAIPITLHSCHTRSDMLFIGVSDDSLCRDMANMFTSTFNEFANSMREQFKPAGKLYILFIKVSDNSWCFFVNKLLKTLSKLYIISIVACTRTNGNLIESTKKNMEGRWRTI